MRMASSMKRFSTLALVFALAACSSNKEKEELEPLALQDLQGNVEVDSLWSRGIGAGQGKTYLSLQPAVADGVVYAASADGEVAAYRLTSGERLWEAELEEVSLTGGVGVGGELVLLGSSEGQVIALSSADGSERWRAQVSGEILSAPQSDGQTVVVQSFDGRVVGLDPASGAQRWIYDSSMPLLVLRGSSTPLMTGDVAFTGFASGKAVALDLASGLPRWETRVAVPKGKSDIERMVDVASGMLLSGDTLFAITYQGSVAALDARSGDARWRSDASSYVGLGLGFGNVYLSDAAGKVQAVGEGDGALRWENGDLLRRQLTAPVVWGNYVAVGDFEGYVHLLSQADGAISGRFRVDSSGLRAAPQVVDNLLVVFANDGTLEVYQLGGE